MSRKTKAEPTLDVHEAAQGVVPAGQPRKRGRPRGQQVMSRERLLAAARVLCARGDFMTASVDDITRQADCSRAAFYLYFKSKEELLQAVVGQNRDLWLQNYRTIHPDVLTNRKALLDWLRRFLRDFQDSGEIMALTILSVPATEAHRVFHQRRCMAVEILGHRIPELCIFREDGSIDEARQWDVILFLYQLEQVAQALYFGGAHLDADLILARLSEQFLSLVPRARLSGGLPVNRLDC